MCGIAGYCLHTSILPSFERLEHMLQAIRKRGPDDEGICLVSRRDNQVQCYRNDHTYPALSGWPHIKTGNGIKHDIAFLHARYAIFDLSPAGHQPFLSRDGAIIAVYNGEIYNFIELRQQLSSEGVNFRTNCDTEVLVEGYAKWKDGLWPKLNGFWAAVLYDRRNHSLVFCRDRAGVAPLYYRETPRGLFFSSTIEPLIDIDGLKAGRNEDAINGFLRTGWKDLDNSTFWEQIRSVPGATAIHLSRSVSCLSQGEARPYWHLPDSLWKESDISFGDAVARFRDIFFNAVDIRMRADVKIAFELSGGLDSSSVVAAAATLSPDKITTYTAKIRSADEEPYARSILHKYTIDYRIMDEGCNGFAHEYADFSKLMEEPYDNPNAYTHYRMLRQMKSAGVQVVLTGAGGDEVFAGYEANFWPKAYQEWRKQGPWSLWKADWHEFCRRFRTWQQVSATLKHYLLDPWKKLAPSRPAKAAATEANPAFQYQQQYGGLSFEEQRRFHFIKALLPFYMRSSDHFTMGIPIEHRFPLLDYRLIEFGLQLPISYLFQGGWTKYILRKAMEPYLPPQIVWRRQKMGFRFPYEEYLQSQEAVFRPLLDEFFGNLNYGRLLKSDPIGLWRFLSVAIWMRNNA